MKKFFLILFLACLSSGCTDDDNNTNINPPTNISNTSITSNSVIINWDSGQENSTYEIEYKESGFNQGSGNLLTTDSNQITLTNLESSTTYDYYLRTNFNNTYSSWGGPFSFTILDLCSVPTNLSVSNIMAGNTSGCVITLNWSSIYDNATYEIDMRFAEEDIDDETIFFQIYTTDTNITLDRIIMNTELVVNVRTNCDDNNYSEWSEPVFFRCLRSGCNDGDISNLFADNITQNSATLSWDANQQFVYHESFDIEYGISGFNLGQGTLVSTTDTSYDLDNLPSGTEFDFYVRGICLDSNSLPNFEGPYTFTTQNDGCSIPMDLQILNTSVDGTHELQWSIIGNSDDVLNYELAVVEVDVPFNQATIITIPNNNATLVGYDFNPNNYNLLQDTTYRIYVRSVCTDGTSSIYIGPIFFTTDITCDIVDVEFVTSDMPNTISIEYSNLNDNATTEIEYGETGFEIGTGTIFGGSNGQFIYKEINNLSSGIYDVYLRSNCGNDVHSEYVLRTVTVSD
ncbi:fibronectin type III domain-containing protein [Winogradskyella sp. R77965]|uniref:fibronectin type III domain-containing protein n=1 Tax=Winogradskyella sp. R77965 TaxID=3093872 RepID=UPI0037DD0E08